MRSSSFFARWASRAFLATFVTLTLTILTHATPARATPPVTPAAQERTWAYLTTGNGHGFQVFDVNKNRITSFLEHPYRYLRPQADPQSDGVGRRNLAWDVFLGL